MRSSNVVLGLLAASALACGPSTEPASVAEGDALARYRGGAITIPDVDRAVLERSADDRSAFGTGNLDAYRDLLRDLASEQLLVAGGRAAGVHEVADLQAEVRDLERQALVQQWLPGLLPRLDAPTPDEVRARYDAAPEAFTQTERRLVLNIFRRLTPETSIDHLRDELARVRRQVMAGASFGTIAREISDSETRHRDGMVGWFERGQLVPKLDALVFALEEGVPSEPLSTGDGVHLFFVETILPAQRISFDEARETIRRRLLDERNEEALVDFEATLTRPEDAVIPTLDEVRALLAGGDPDAVVLRIGDCTIDVERFGDLLAQERLNVTGYHPVPPAQRVLDRLRRRELIYRTHHEDHPPLAAHTAEAIARERDRLIADRQLERLVDAELDRRPEALATFYEHHRARFAPPVRWTLRRLMLPLGPAVRATMAQLESLPRDPATAPSLETLAQRFGGQVVTLERQPLNALVRIHERLAENTSALDDGMRSAPFRTPEALEVVEVIERETAPPPAYEEVKEAVRASYRTIHGQGVVDDVLDRLLRDADFRVDEDRLATWVAAGAAPTTNLAAEATS